MGLAERAESALLTHDPLWGSCLVVGVGVVSFEFGDDGAIVQFGFLVLSDFAVMAFFACGAVFGIASGVLGCEGTFGWIVEELANRVARFLFERSSAGQRCSDLKSAEEDAGGTPIDVAFAVFAEHLVDGEFESAV